MIETLVSLNSPMIETILSLNPPMIEIILSLNPPMIDTAFSFSNQRYFKKNKLLARLEIKSWVAPLGHGALETRGSDVTR